MITNATRIRQENARVQSLTNSKASSTQRNMIQKHSNKIQAK